MVAFDLISTYRAHTFLTAPGLRINSQEQAVEFVNKSGFIFFWPISGVPLPSLWTAAAGDRPVADAHDDPGHITWEWKDSALGKHIWYYARVLHHRNSIISLTDLPYFYALSPNYGEPELDYLEQYQQGKLTLESKLLYEALLHEGALDTISLRRASHMAGAGSETRFNRALDQLQGEFKVLPIGTAKVGAWRYAFVYDLVHRHFPTLIDRARDVAEKDARSYLTLRYLRMVGAVPAKTIQKLFGWPISTTLQTLQLLENQGSIQTGVIFDDQPGEWIVLTQLASG